MSTADPLLAPERLAAVARSGLLDTGPEESFDRLAALARRVLRAPFAFVTVVDDQRSFWKARVGVDTSPGAPSQNTVEESLCQHVVRSGEPLVSGDIRLDPLTASSPSIEAMGVVAWAGYPVHAPDGQVLGSFCVVDTVSRDWTEDDRATLQTLSQVASAEVALRSTAADAVAALDTARDAQRRVQLLAASGELLRAGLDLDTVLATVTSIAVPALGQAAVVYTAGKQGAVVPRAWTVRHDDPEQEARLREHLSSTELTLQDAVGAGYVLRTGLAQRVTVDDDALGPRGASSADGAGPARPPLTGALCVPLRARGRVFGELQIVSQAAAPYTDADLALAEELADRAALALDNAVLFGEQRDASVALQQALLTPAPQPDDLEIAVRYLPATAHAEVGGDWHDAFVQAGGGVVLVIGDVVGHDLHAAAGMGQLRSMVRVLGYQGADSPADVLVGVDEAVDGLGVATMATAVLARVEQSPSQAESRERTLRWSNAGHPPPLLLLADGTVEVLATPSEPLIGLGPGFTRTDHERALPDGSVLLLYTDGLVERRDRHLDAGTAALAEVLAGLVGAPLEELCDAVLAGALPGAHEDDVALLALRAG